MITLTCVKVQKLGKLIGENNLRTNSKDGGKITQPVINKHPPEVYKGKVPDTNGIHNVY